MFPEKRYDLLEKSKKCEMKKNLLFIIIKFLYMDKLPLHGNFQKWLVSSLTCERKSIPSVWTKTERCHVILWLNWFTLYWHYSSVNTCSSLFLSLTQTQHLQWMYLHSAGSVYISLRLSISVRALSFKPPPCPVHRTEPNRAGLTRCAGPAPQTQIKISLRNGVSVTDLSR